MEEASLDSTRSTSRRAALALSLLVAAALLALAGCGGGGDSKSARKLIDNAFKQSIPSADMTLNIEAKVDGVAQLQQPVKLQIAGPYQSNGKSKLPSLDWKVSVSGGGQAFSGGVISTGENLFVNFQNQDYEVGADTVAQLNSQLGQQTGSGKTLKDFGIDPQSWIKNPTDEGDEDVNGVSTTHVKADVDVAKMLQDFNKTIDQAGGAMGSNTPNQLTADQIKKVDEVVKDPKFDIYVGKKDDKIRRLSVKVDFEIPSDQQAKLQGASGGTVSFSIDFAKVGEKQTITAPQNAKPISELQQQLGGLGGGLGGLGGSGSSGGSGSGGDSGSGGSGGSNPTPQQFEKYSKCLEGAKTADDIQKCAALIQ
jgi:hypothetical protein